MKQSDPPQLRARGSLPRPGPAGRIVRLGLGALCLYALYEFTTSHEELIVRPLSSASLVPLIAVTLFAFNYVVSIGFGGSWGLRPLVASAVLLLSAAGIAFLWSGNPNGPILGVPLILWLGYFYAHLGISFILAALIATPGCEMRAIPEMLGRLTGRTSDEHQCPAAFITRIDAWEQRLRRQP